MCASCGSPTALRERDTARGFISGVLLEAVEKRLVYVKIHGLKGIFLV